MGGKHGARLPAVAASDLSEQPNVSQLRTRRIAAHIAESCGMSYGQVWLRIRPAVAELAEKAYRIRCCSLATVLGSDANCRSCVAALDKSAEEKA